MLMLSEEPKQKKTSPRLTIRSQTRTKMVETSKINLQLGNISGYILEHTGFMTVPRSCGGQNSPSFQRQTKLQHITPSVHQETVVVCLKNQQVEVNIQGSDGKIYKGMMYNPFTPTHTKYVDYINNHPGQQKTYSLNREDQDLKKDRKRQQEPMKKALDKRSEVCAQKVDTTSKINPQLGTISESIPQQTDAPMLVSRTCGGCHTLTFSQRFSKLHGFTPSARLQSVLAGLQHQQVEADIQGSDGKMYKGRLDADLIPVHTKYGNFKSQGSKKYVPSLNIITLPLSEREATGGITVRTNNVNIK